MKTLKEFTDTELKALAFDQINQANICQANLEAINQEMKSRTTNVQPLEPKIEVAEPKKK